MNRISSILGGFAVIAIALVFIVQFRPATNVQASAEPTCAVEISGECISSTHFWAAYRLLAPRGADADRLRAMALRRQTVEGLVERNLLVQDAARLGISVSEGEITEELASGRAHVSLPADKARQLGYALGLDENLFRMLDVKDRKTKKFDAEAYEKQVRLIAKMSPTDFREYQREELIAARMRDLIKARARVGESEAFTQFSREKSTATLRYVKLDRRYYADVIVDTSQAAIDAWAAKNGEEIDKIWESRKAQFLPECYLARHILAKIDPNAPDQDAEKVASKKKIEAAIEAIKGGESFEDAARRLSDDGSAVRGGDLGCVTKGRMVKPFEDALFALTKPGELSSVVETQFGAHVIKLVKIAKEADAEKEGRAQTIFELYLSHEAERMAAEGAKQILAAVGAGKSMEDALAEHLAAVKPAAKEAKGKGKDKAKKAEPKEAGETTDQDEDAAPGSGPQTADNHPAKPFIDTTLPFNVAGDPIEGVAGGENIAAMAFKLDKPGAVPGNVISLESGYAVIQLKEKTPATQEQWDKDREFYVSAMRTAKQNDALVGYIKRLRASLGSEIKYNAALVEEPKATTEGEADPLGEP